MDLIAENVSYTNLLLAKNQIEVNINPASLTIIERSKLRYFLTILIPEYLNATSFIEMPEMDNTEEPIELIAGSTVAKGAFFNIEKILQSIVVSVPPKFAQSNILPAPGIVAKFKTRKRIEDDGVELSDAIGGVEYCIRAGINERFFFEWKNKFFSAYLGANRKFLTYCPTQWVLPSQQVYLYFLNNLNPTPQALKLRVQCRYTDGSEDATPTTVFVQLSQGMEVYIIPVGPAILGILDRNLAVKNYSVWLINQADEAITQEVVYKIDYQKYIDTRCIQFLNSLGGFDSICFKGRAIEQLVGITKDITERIRPFEATASFSDTVVNKVTGERELICNTTWLTDAERDWLEDLALSSEIYLQTDRDFLPLTLINDSYLSDDSNENIIGRSFIFRYSNKETSYSSLPVAVIEERPTGWRAYGSDICELDGYGKRTGNAIATHLEKYYTDNDEAVTPAEVKPNSIGTDGYLYPFVSAGCSTPNYLSEEFTQVGTFNRANCANGYIGGPASITVPADRWGSEISVADANTKAAAEWATINNQATANTSGTCTLITAAGLEAKYYQYTNNNTGLPPVNIFTTGVDATRIETTIYSDGTSLPAGIASNYFAARYVGYIKAPITGPVTIKAISDDGLKLWIGGNLAINQWINSGTNTGTATIEMVANQYYPVVIEYFQNEGGQALQLKWSYSGQAEILIPSSKLLH